MPYLRHNTPSVRSFPKRSRGMGQEACNWIQTFLCGSSAVQSVGGTDCSVCNAITPPSIASNAGVPTVPTGYNADTGEIDMSNTTGETGTYPYTVSYPATVAPNAYASTCPVSFFNGEPCWGPVGLFTLATFAVGGFILFKVAR
jgi:hypothetical protein